jgi:hypothetical protein
LPAEKDFDESRHQKALKTVLESLPSIMAKDERLNHHTE